LNCSKFKRFSLLLLFLSYSEMSVAQPSNCSEHYFMNEAPDILNNNFKIKTDEICYVSFGVWHSGLSRTPLWSAERLTSKKINAAKKIKREDRFFVDGRLSIDRRSELSDYKYSGYDRGHLTPSANMSSVEEQHESFSLANIIPQNPNNNRILWRNIEDITRKIALKNKEIFVITGVLFLGDKVVQINDRVLVPTHLYKIILDPFTMMSGVYLVENKSDADVKIISLRELNELSGIQFMPKINKNLLNKAISLPLPKTK